jgi:hypothetical protein
VLRCVAEMYEGSYPGSKPGENDPYLPIDVTAVASKLECKPQLLFGYLYYYLDHKHRYQTGDNAWTHLFALKVGERRHCVNYPYLAGILAAHDFEHRRNLQAIWMAGAALVLSVGSIIAQLITGWPQLLLTLGSL